MINSLYPYFKLDSLNGFIALAVGLFFILTLLYSFGFMRQRPRLFGYYTYIILTAMAAVSAVLTNNLILLLVFWGFLGLTLYLLINMEAGAAAAAKKTLIIVGGSDAFMLLGVVIIYYLTGTFQMDKIRLGLDNNLAVLAYIFIAIACFAKAGAMPFHSWIPDCAKEAPVPVVAYLPAALDKLLGIYLLARISLNLFAMNKALNIFLMLVGAFTIIAAVMMALVQHNMKRILGYHAVSQVGYMVLGIGTGNPIGIAGGLFHMLNNSVYKQGLFLIAGNVEKNSGTTDLDKLGGLAKIMPLTYISAIIASLSISGVPPFNGFFSKWMVYQGLTSQLQNADYGLRITAIFCLVAAMFGSSLTLASFMKLLHAVFLGQTPESLKNKKISEVSWTMWFPCLALAGVCVLFGVFAFGVPLKYFILPAVSRAAITDLSGIWSPALATVLIIIGLALGFIIFVLSRAGRSLRQDTSFTGSETRDLKEEEARVSATEFYNTVKEIGFLHKVYREAQRGVFDIYEQAKKIFSLSKVLQYLHNGILPTYLVWMLLGMAGLFWILVR
jgi:formate hydrogenlyase subunit 3/multisubunit Na+/H+ antiporter MnhD subunit